jgi:hypothetical protein
MNILRMTGIAVLSLILLAAGEKDEQVIKHSGYIVAGQKDSAVIYQDFNPDLESVLINVDAGGMPTTSFEGYLPLDIDLDGKPDLKFFVYIDLMHDFNGGFAYVEGCDVSDIPDSRKFELCGKPFMLNDTINEKANWRWIDPHGSSISNLTYPGSYSLWDIVEY